LGEEHFKTTDSRTALASILQDRGDAAAAEPLLRQVLQAPRARMGEDHPDTVQAPFNVAVNLASQKRFAEAQPPARRAGARRRVALGAGPPQPARALAALADILHSQGRFDEAADVGRAAVRSFEAARLRVSFTGLERVAFARYSPLPGLICCLARS